jgi:hypothetical protein
MDTPVPPRQEDLGVQTEAVATPQAPQQPLRFELPGEAQPPAHLLEEAWLVPSAVSAFLESTGTSASPNEEGEESSASVVSLIGASRPVPRLIPPWVLPALGSSTDTSLYSEGELPAAMPSDLSDGGGSLDDIGWVFRHRAMPQPLNDEEEEGADRWSATEASSESLVSQGRLSPGELHLRATAQGLATSPLAQMPAVVAPAVVAPAVVAQSAPYATQPLGLRSPASRLADHLSEDEGSEGG